MRIGLTTNVAIQTLGTIIQGLNAAGGVFSGELKWVAGIAVGGLQLVVAVLAHYSNPDSTPAAVAYVKK